MKYFKQHIAHISFNGIINEKETFNFINKIQRMEKHKKRIKGIIFSIDSPGGSIVHSQKIYDYLRSFSDNNIKIHTYANSLAASGGYFLLTSGDKIFARKDSLVGSVGVIGTHSNINSLFKKLLLDKRISLSSYKDNSYPDYFKYFDPTRKSTEEENLKAKEIMIEFIEPMYKTFLSHVIENRKRQGKILSEEQLKLISTADVYTGEEALNVGLIDSLYSSLNNTTFVENFIKEDKAIDKDINVINYTEANFIERKLN